MADTHERNADQVASWNGNSGRRWVERQVFMDAMFAPVNAALFAATDLAPGMTVFDIGCGSGDTTLAIAKAVSPGGHVLGLDISAPLLARARERAPAGTPVQFIEGDATVYGFRPGVGDLLFSRFGVMFFAQPVVAFANMRKGLKSGARVAFACWREGRLNPWITLPLVAARAVLPPSPPADPEAPGPFAFASEQRVRSILGEAGFSDIALKPIDMSFDTAGGGGVDAALTAALEIGPASRALDDQPAAIRDAAIAAIRVALGPHETNGRVMLDGAIWIVTACNP